MFFVLFGWLAIRWSFFFSERVERGELETREEARRLYLFGCANPIQVAKPKVYLHTGTMHDERIQTKMDYFHILEFGEFHACNRIPIIMLVLFSISSFGFGLVRFGVDASVCTASWRLTIFLFSLFRLNIWIRCFSAGRVYDAQLVKLVLFVSVRCSCVCFLFVFVRSFVCLLRGMKALGNFLGRIWIFIYDVLACLVQRITCCRRKKSIHVERKRKRER